MAISRQQDIDALQAEIARLKEARRKEQRKTKFEKSSVVLHGVIAAWATVGVTRGTCS